MTSKPTGTMIKRTITYDKKDLLNLVKHLKNTDIPLDFPITLEDYIKDAPEILPISPPMSVWAISFHQELEQYYPTYYRAIFLASLEELPKIQSDDRIITSIVAWRFEQDR